MSISRWIAVILLCAPLLGCVSEFCTRHSDCPPEQGCGAAGICVPLEALAVDASLADATHLDDASFLDAAVSDASHEDAAMIDAGPDAGASVADASLVPPADASLIHPDASSVPPADANVPDAMRPVSDFRPGMTPNVAEHTGNGGMTVQVDAAGLAP